MRPDRRTLRYWSKVHDRLPLLDRIKHDVQTAGWRMRLDSGWAEWDMEIYGSRYVKVRLTTATEHQGGPGVFSRLGRMSGVAHASNGCTSNPGA